MAISVSRLLGVALGAALAVAAADYAARPSLLAQEPLPAASFPGTFDLGADDVPDLVAGSAGSGLVNVFSGADLSLLASAPPFGAAFTGGVHVAAGDITGDGVTDVVTAMASAGGRVRAFDGSTLTLLADFEPYGPGFTGGVAVALGDINGDGRADLVVGPASGAGSVRAYGATGVLLGSGAPFGADPGGVFVAIGDVNGDGLGDVVASQARGGLVTVYSGNGFVPIGSGAPYGPAFAGGVSVAVGDVNGDGRGDVITAPASGAGSVRVFDVATLAVLVSGLPFGPPTYAGGMRVAAADFNGDGVDDVVVSGGAGSAQVRVFSGATQAVLADFLAFPPTVLGGAHIAAPARSGIRFVSPATATFTAGTAGSFDIRTLGAPPVTGITQTGTLPAGLTFTDNGDGTARLSGTPSAGSGRSYSLTLTAANGTARTATQTLTVRVEEAPAFTSSAAATFRVGQADTFEVVTRGFPVPDLTVTGTLPSGLTFTDLDTGRGTIAGTPAAGTSGMYTLTLSAGNGIGAPTTQTFTLTVETGAVFTSPSAVTFVAGTPNTFTITTLGEPPVTTITRTGTLPTGLTFTDNGNGTATVSGTAAPGSGGTYPQNLAATNGVGTPGTQVLTITVQEGPQITSAAATTFVTGTAATFNIVATGAPSPTLTVTGALPAGITFTDNGGGNGVLSGTATVGGVFPLTITAGNGVGTPATQSFTLTVQAPAAFTSASGVTAIVGTPIAFAITTSGVPAVSAITQAGTLPSGMTYTDNGNGTAVLSGTPAAGTGGTYPMTLTASNGVGSPAVQAFTLTVHEAPQITSGATTTFTVGTAGSFTVTTTGTPVPTLTATGTLPAGVTFVDNANGTATLSGAPTAGGSFPLTISAGNGVGTAASQPFTLTVNQAPAITSAAATTFRIGEAGSFSVTATGVPVPTLTMTGTLPSGVTFTDNGGGTATLAGTPAAGTGGSYALTITAANGILPDAVQSFSLGVEAAPAITSAATTTFTVGSASSFTVTAVGAPAPALSVAGTLPAGVTFTPGTGVMSGTPTQTGTFGLQFTAANGVPPDAVQPFSLMVVCPAITVTPTSLPEGTYNTAYGPVTFTASGSTGSTLGWSATGLPAGISIGATSGDVSGTPTTTVANAAVVVTVTDEFGCTGAVNTALTVRPSAVDNTFSNGVGNTQFVVGGAGPATPHVYVSGSVLSDDSGPGTLSAVVTTPPAQGTVAMNTNGTFVYTPAAGIPGAASFGYTLTDGNGVTDTAIVTIGMSGMVWYVNDSGANGDGRSHSPFNALNNAAAPSQPGQAIYVHRGTANTPGALALKVGQTLWGEGASFTVNALTIPAGLSPTLRGTVTLASSSTIGGVHFTTSTVSAIDDPAAAVSGVTIGNGVSVTSVGAPGVVLSNAAGTFTFERITVVGGSNGISLANLSGPFTVVGTGAPTSGGTLQNITGDAIRLSNTTGLVSLSYMGFLGIGDMAGPIDTVSNHQAIRGENVLGGLALNHVTMNQLSDHAILGSQFASPGTPTVWNGLTITNSTITNSNRFHVAGIADANEAMVRILGLRGTVTVADSLLQLGNAPLELLANAGALTMTVTNSAFQAYKENLTGGFQPTAGEHCVDVVVQGAATADITIGHPVNAALGNQFTNCRVGSIRVLQDSAATGIVNATIGRNTFTVDDLSSPAGADFAFPMGGVLASGRGSAGATLNVLVQNNVFSQVMNASGGVGQLTLLAEGGQFRARVDTNQFQLPGNAPWFIRAAENQQAHVELRNNTVVGGTFNCTDPACGGGYPSPGLRAIADAQRGGSLDLTVTDDVYAPHDTGFDPGNTVEIQGNDIAGAPTVCAALSGNQAPDGYALESTGGAIFNLSRGSSSEPSASCDAGAPGACQNVLSQNGNTGGAGAPTTTPPAVAITGTITLTAGACQLPTGGIFQP